MQPTTKWQNAVHFGVRKYDNTRINLRAPSWDCDWYWSLGYLDNEHEHYHLDDYQQVPWLGAHRNINMYDALLADYTLNPLIEYNLWLFCELFSTAYTLSETAAIYNRGGSHYTMNPLKNIIKSDEGYRRINWVVLPAIFDKIGELLEVVAICEPTAV